MLISRASLSDLARRLRGAHGSLRSASVEVPHLDPLDVVRAGATAFGRAVFYSSPDGHSIGALGTAWMRFAGGADRFRRIDGSLANLPAGTPALLGFSFKPEGPTDERWEGFPPAALVVPEITVTRRRGRSILTLSVAPGVDPRLVLGVAISLRRPAEPDPVLGDDLALHSVPTPEAWRDLVDESLAAVSGGVLAKVVLARTVELTVDSPPQPFGLVAGLRDRYPASRVFGWQAGDSTFLGASPEVLVSVVGDRIIATPLAGSAPRGADAAEDRLLGDGLLASEKDHIEHAIVVEDIVDRLAPLAVDVERTQDPTLQRFATVQHLATRVVATGNPNTRLLDVVDALHPTAAVGGAPRREALAFIDKLEGIDRGWYAGGIGWVEPGGDGEVAIGLRCALLRGEHATLYAGSGIVSGSEAGAELEETRLKLRPMLDLLTGA